MKTFFMIFSILLGLVPVSVSAQFTLQDSTTVTFRFNDEVQARIDQDKKQSAVILSLIQKEADSLLLVVDPEELEVLHILLNSVEQQKNNPLALGMLRMQILYVSSSKTKSLIKNAKTFDDWNFINLVSLKKEYQDLAKRKMLKSAKSFDDFMTIYNLFSETESKEFAYNGAKTTAQSFDDFEMLYYSAESEADKVSFLQKLVILSKNEEHWQSISILPSINLQKLADENIQ